MQVTPTHSAVLPSYTRGCKINLRGSQMINRIGMQYSKIKQVKGNSLFGLTGHNQETCATGDEGSKIDPASI